jgi:transcriptional regulator with XRE-family HTH domain
LAAELRRLRGNRTGTKIARDLGWSPAKISRYELGQGGFPLEEVEKLLDYYGVDEPRRAQLVGLAADTNVRGWWEDYADAMTPDFMEFIGLEAEANSVAQWQVETVPGLFQTPDYAWNVMDAVQDVMPTPPSVVRRRVDLRVARQWALTEREPPLRLSAIVDESALLRQIGGPDVMRAQLTRMVEMAELPNVDLRVLPLRRASSLMDTSFVIFEFGEDEDGNHVLGDVVSTESLPSGELYVEGEASYTYTYRLVFRALTKAALSPEESREVVEKAINSWRDV